MSSERPAGATERALAALWSELLAVPDVGPDASFIELGGDSITATQCINRIERAFGCEVSFGLFLEPDMTLRTLAAVVDEALRGLAAHAPEERVTG